jgi:regulatory protein
MDMTPRHPSRATIFPVALRNLNRLGVAALFDYAVAALARRSLTQIELRARLKPRAARPADVENVLQRLAEIGYLDDARLAESYSRFRRDYEGLGKQRVLRDLARRGVDPAVAEQAVAGAYAGTDELELIRDHLRRKLGSCYGETRVDDPKRLTSLYRSLIRAGFPSAKIVIALQEISSNSDWLEASADQPDPAGDHEAYD